MTQEEEIARSEAINALVAAYIARGDIETAKEAAWLGKRDLRNTEVDSLVKVLAQRGNLGLAQKAAQLASRGLAAHEFDLVMESCIEAGRRDEALEVAKLRGRPLSTGEIDALVMIGIEQERKREKYRGEAFKSAKLGASPGVFRYLAHFYLERGFIAEAREAAKLGGSELSSQANESIVTNSVKWGWISTAQEAAQRVGRSLSTAEIDALVITAIKDHRNYSQAFQAARLGASKKTIEYLVTNCLKHAWIDSAQNAAQLVGRKLTPQEIVAGAKACFTTGLVHSIRSIKKEALKAVELGGPPEAIDSFVAFCLQKSWISLAQEIAQLGGRELTTEEIRELSEALAQITDR